MNERPLSASPSSFLFHFLSLLFMALLTFLPQPNSDSKKQQPSSKPKRSRTHHKQQNSYSSAWHQIKNFLSCKQVEGSRVHDPSKEPVSSGYSCSKLGSCSSMCSFRDFVHGNTRVVHRADNSPGSSSMGQETGLLRGKETNGPLSSSYSSRSFSGSVRSTYSDGSSFSSSSRGMQFGKLSGCYECHTTVDPSRFPIPMTTLCACSQCGEVFQKIESLEHHQAVRHAVSELGPDDSSRNIVEIIFKSSWLKKGNTICKIERILKVHNTQRTIQWFEDCRDAVKIRANSNTKKNPRCAADGNELLRFHCTTLTCTLGARGSTSLCGSVPGCGVCTVIPHGFQGKAARGILTTASSGRAHDCLEGVPEGRRAMLVCRVIAGRVRRVVDDAATEEDGGSAAGLYDSVARYPGIYSNLEELYVFNPRAILPCFLVIYQALDPYV